MVLHGSPKPQTEVRFLARLPNLFFIFFPKSNKINGLQGQKKVDLLSIRPYTINIIRN